MTVEQVTADHYKAQQMLSRQAVGQAQALWSEVKPASVLESWLAQLAAMIRVLTGGQTAAASLTQPYLNALAMQQGIRPAGAVIPAAFAGTAADGRPLTSLLMQPALRTLGLLATGADDQTALLSGLESLTRIVDTEISDASRAADHVGMVANRRWVTYVRHVSLPACGRCIILAGREYSWSTGFLRHPRCDCEMRPSHEGEAPPPTPQELFEQMTAEEQAKAFTVAGAEAIRLGADANQVVNARRGMRQASVFGRDTLITTEGTTTRGLFGRSAVAGGERTQRQAEEFATRLTREGPEQRRIHRERVRTPRLMPEAILEAANGDRDEAIRLLERFGFLIPSRPARSRRAVLESAPGMRDGFRAQSNEEGLEWARDRMPLPDLTEAERKAIRDYTGGAYEDVNKRLRGSGLPSDPEDFDQYDRIIRGVDSAFEKAKASEAFIVHRSASGTYAEYLGADIGRPETMKALVGSTFTEQGFMSTNVGSRAVFDDDVYLMIRVPAGHGAMNVMPVSSFGEEEREILLDRNSRYIVHAVYKKYSPDDQKDVWFMELEIVPDGWEKPAGWAPDPYGDAYIGYQDGGEG